MSNALDALLSSIPGAKEASEHQELAAEIANAFEDALQPFAADPKLSDIELFRAALAAVHAIFTTAFSGLCEAIVGLDPKLTEARKAAPLEAPDIEVRNVGL